jgi:hypothetical protein
MIDLNSACFAFSKSVFVAARALFARQGFLSLSANWRRTGASDATIMALAGHLSRKMMEIFPHKERSKTRGNFGARQGGTAGLPTNIPTVNPNVFGLRL